MKKANHLDNHVQVTSNSKKSDVAKFATCSEPISTGIFKITSNAQHGNEAIKNIMLNRYKNLSKFHWISKTYLTCHEE